MAAATAPNGPPPVFTGGGPGPDATDVPFAVERLLEELQEYSASAKRERAEFRRERVELNARLRRLEHELQAEEHMGTDLTERIATLEAVIKRERREHAARLAGAVSHGPAPQESPLDPPPATHEDPTGCRQLLGARLREAGVSFAWPGAAAASWDGRERLSTAIPLMPSAVPMSRSSATTGEPTAPPPLVEPMPEQRSRASAQTDGSGTQGVPIPAWKRQWVLRSHLDGARCVVCDDQAGILISCGEDALVKAWDLTPLWRGAPSSDDVEPYVTFRGHTAPVFAMTYRPQGRVLFSAGMDYSIRVWRLPESRSYHPYGASLAVQQCAMRAGLLVGHSDSVWCLQQHPHLPYISSASADGSIGLWAAEADGTGREAGAMEASFTLRPPHSLDDGAMGAEEAACDVPACVAWAPTGVSQLVAGYVSSRVAVFDVKRGAQVLDLLPDASGDGAERPSVTSVCCHETSQLAVTGHVDNCARLLDLSSGRFVARLSDHGDAVTSLSIDPAKGYCLVTGSHDGYIRSYDLRTNRCVQALWLHRPKFDEAVHSVHHSLRVLATAGADGNVVVMSPFD